MHTGIIYRNPKLQVEDARTVTGLGTVAGWGPEEASWIRRASGKWPRPKGDCHWHWHGHWHGAGRCWPYDQNLAG